MCHLVHFHPDCALFTSSGRATPTAQFCSLFQYFCNSGSQKQKKKQNNDLGRKKKTDNMIRGIQKAFGVAELLTENGCKNISK